MSRYLAFIALVLYFLLGCDTKNPDFKVVQEHKNFMCPPPGLEEFVDWGKSGQARRCVIKNGSFVASEGGQLISGQYKDGSQIGTWRWYNKEGKVIKTVNYATPANR
jgi:hypothetical protein